MAAAAADAHRDGPRRSTGAAGAARTTVAVLLGLAMLAGAAQLARTDAGLGPAAGPDRLLEAIDADPEPDTADSVAARSMLDARPVDGAAYRVLAQSALAAGDVPAAQRLLDIALRHWPRDAVARALQAQLAFEREDFNGALLHLDAMMRAAPGMRAPTLTSLTPHLADAQLADAIVERLATDPPWRAAFAHSLRTEDVPALAGDAVLQRLSGRIPLTPGEVDTRVSLLRREGQALRARAVWLASLGDASGEDARVFDGGFERDGVRGAYAWSMQPPAGVQVGFDTRAPHDGAQSLRLQFDGRPVRFDHLRQALALTPGRYLLSVATDASVESERPFEWRVHCAGGDAELLRLALPRTAGWRESRGQFVVPSGCAAQSLVLRHASRSIAERRIRGTLGVDAVRIIPMPLEPASH